MVVVEVCPKKGEAMVKRRLQRFLFALSFLGASWFTASPYPWAPVGTAVDAQGYATEGGQYVFGDAVTENDSPHPTYWQLYNSWFNTISNPATPEENTLYICGELIDPAAPDGVDGSGFPVLFDGTTFPITPLNRVLDGNNATIPCSLKVDGDIRVDAIDEDMTVRLLSDVDFEPYNNSAGVTVINAAGLNPSSASLVGLNAGVIDPNANTVTTYGWGYSQIFFNAAQGKTITFHADYNLTFRGRTVDPLQNDYTDMLVTFGGQGRVVFKMADGTAISFDGDIDNTSPVFVDPATKCESLPLDDANNFTGFFNGAGGTRVFIIMDQTLDQVTRGQNKVVFARKDAPEQTNDPFVPFPADPSLRDLIYVGPNSVITYVSDNITGEVQNTEAPGFAGLEFDVTNKGNDDANLGAINSGTGRMVLMIRGAYAFDTDPNSATYLALIEKYPFNDGAVLVSGQYAARDADTNEFTPISIRETYDFTIPAGQQAIMAITDNGLYSASNKPFAPTYEERRGLLIFNDVANHGKLLADPYWDLYNVTFDANNAITFQSQGSYWAPSNPDNYLFITRKGFVVGVNGKLDVYHNTYCDHVSAFSNCLDMLAVYDFFTDNNVFLKRRNPSAFIVDGLDPRLFSVEPNPYTLATSDFIVADPITRAPEDVRQAEVQLRGNGALYLRSAVSTADSYAYNFWGDYFSRSIDPNDIPGTIGIASTPHLDPFVDYVSSLAVGDFGVNGDFPDAPEMATYDGYNLSPNFQTVQLGEGEHVFDAEGQVRVISRPSIVTSPIQSFYSGETVPFDSYQGTKAEPYTNASAQRNYAPAAQMSRSGVVQAMSVWIDHTGQEIVPAAGYAADNPVTTRILRPLLPSGVSYVRYNSPGIFLNNFVSFFDTHFIHSDGTKLVNATPQSDPAITGGERYYFSYTAIPEYISSNADWWNNPDPNDFNTLAIDTDADRFRTPEIRLFNSWVDMQESLCATGVRWVVMDVPSENTTTGGRYSGFGGSNNSSFRFYDHGDANDTLLTGYGRMLVNGSMLAYMTNIIYNADEQGNVLFQTCTDVLDQSNFAMENTYGNIFRHNAPQLPANCADQPDINLWLQNGTTEFAAVDPVLQRHYNPSTPNTDASRKLQRAHHLVVLGITDNGINNFHVGWPLSPETQQVKGGSVFFPYPDELEDLPENSFSIDALQVKPATLTVDGKVICFAAFDFDGMRSKVPVSDTGDDTGVFYIDHGGKITITPKDVTLNGSRFDEGNTAIGRRDIDPAECVIDAMIAQRVWGDYDKATELRFRQMSGIIDLPHDQTVMAHNFGIQPYGLSAAMFASNTDDNNNRRGYVRLGYRTEKSEPNAQINCAFGDRQPLRDRTGAEEVVVGWFFRDYRGQSIDNAINEQPVKSRSIKNSIERAFGDRKTQLSKLATRTPTRSMDNKKSKAARTPSTKATRSVKGSTGLITRGTDFFAPKISKELLRSTESSNAPVVPPTDLLYVGPGDTIEQLRVAGATMSDPFHLLVSGHPTLPHIGRVREITTEATSRDLATDHLVGEGAHAALFVEFGGTIGLGNRHWNEHSISAWNLLGKDYVTIYPMGDGIIELNSDLLVVDSQPIIATVNFGTFEGTDADRTAHKLTFYSSDAREIRVPAYGELDLTSFAQNLPAGKQQIIAFEGKTTLVFEEGAKLRLPENNGLVLYFSDESRLVFEGSADPVDTRQCDDTMLDPDNGFLVSNPDVINPIDDLKIKIVGRGQIWLNKQASMEVNDTALVAVQSDDLSPVTDLTISIQRNASFQVGDEQLPGGAFEVGNPYNRNETTGNGRVQDPFGESVVNQGNHRIAFNLLINGRRATTSIDREGFMGFGAGVLRKYSNPNGRATEALTTVPNAFANNTTGGAALQVGPNPAVDATGAAVPQEPGYPVFTGDRDQAWLVRQLYNVDAVNVEMTNGFFVHRNMFDGSSSNASLLAIGPSASYRWAINGQGDASLRGGGNVMYVPATSAPEDESPYTDVYVVNIWDYAGPLSPAGEGYSIMASGQMIINRQNEAAHPSVVFGESAGRAFIDNDPANFFNLLASQPFNEQGSSFMRLVSFAIDDQEQVVDYVVSSAADTPKYAAIINGLVATGAAEIVRDENPNIIGTDTRSLEAADRGGWLGGYGDGGTNGRPTRFVVAR